MNVLILGANGFIGSHLIQGILESTDWKVSAFDLSGSNLTQYTGNPHFSFTQGDLFTADDWLKQAVAASDAVLPLAGIAKPSYYLSKPLWTFELDFEENLKIVRMCVAADKRVIFPSTSEVYGMSTDTVLREDESPLIVGPINKMRWIYSCGKQMMDRVIVAYGQEKGLRYTIFRPFNWIGPRLDTFRDAEERTARSITQMVHDVLSGRGITLVNGGGQHRSFTHISDGIRALLAILADEKASNEKIFNIGNPANNASIKELAHLILNIMKEIPSFREAAEKASVTVMPAEEYYGNGYDDMQNRVPSIEAIGKALGWEPRVPLREAVELTVRSYLDQPLHHG
jgi:nucleoside-diphosphate-sugar epimerase